MIKDAEILAITITFAVLRSRFPKQQFNETITFVTRLLKQSCDFIIVPEWRLSTGAIHYHGTVSIFDRIKWHKQTLPSLTNVGFCKFKPIDNYDKWSGYLAKEQCVAQGILGENFFLPICTHIDKNKEKASAKQLKGGGIKPSIHDYFNPEVME